MLLGGGDQLYNDDAFQARSAAETCALAPLLLAAASRRRPQFPELSSSCHAAAVATLTSADASAAQLAGHGRHAAALRAPIHARDGGAGNALLLCPLRAALQPRRHRHRLCAHTAGAPHARATKLPLPLLLLCRRASAPPRVAAVAVKDVVIVPRHELLHVNEWRGAAGAGDGHQRGLSPRRRARSPAQQQQRQRQLCGARVRRACGMCA